MKELILIASLLVQNVPAALQKLQDAIALLSGPTIVQATCDTLQASLNTAKPGDTITLPSAAVCSGNYVLPAKTGGSFITLKTVDGGGLAKLYTLTSEPALRTVPGSHHWILTNLEFQGSGYGEVVRLGDGAENQRTFESVPYEILLDKVYIHGDPIKGQKRGLAMNCRNCVISNSHISDIKAIGQDSQAIMVWNTPGGIDILNNYLEASGENIMIGGGDSASPELLPTAIVISSNTLTKPVSWRGHWLVKNLLELKVGKKVAIFNNTLDTVWADGQIGYAVVFTVRNQDGTAPWSTIETVTFEHNIVRHMAGGIQILGRDNNAPSGVLTGLVIRNNTFTDINPPMWGNNGRQVFIAGGPQQVTLDTNDFSGQGLNTFLSLDDEAHPIVGLQVLNNRAMEGEYGVIGSGGTPGYLSLAMFAPGYVWSRNTLVRTVLNNFINYPAGTEVVFP